MKVVKSIDKLKRDLSYLKKQGKKVGFVPTMGALHDGHLSLIEQASKENEVVVVSIFVNPTQFNDKKDYTKYPRILEKDIEKLNKVKCDFLFTPEEKEMYPEEDQRQFDFGNLDKVMEGKHRPGHFRGVGLIVSKLFEVVEPHKAYFGEKDFQQVAVIKHLTKQLDLDIDVVACPIVREKDGLAMSSRNMLLTEEQRKVVPLIAQTINHAKEKSTHMSIQETKDWVIRTINKNPLLDVEYFEIVGEDQLNPIDDWSENINKVGCIAVQVGSVRLIDNVRFYS